MTLSVTSTDSALATLAVATATLENGDRATVVSVDFDPAEDADEVFFVRVESAGVVSLYDTQAHALAGGATGRKVPSSDGQTGSLVEFVTNWVVLTATHLKGVAALELLDRPDEMVDADATVNTEYDPAGETRRKWHVDRAVEQVRYAVESGGRVQLSATAGSVPPEAVAHMSVWAAWRLLNATPGSPSGDGPVSALLNDPSTSDLRRLYDEAVAYLKAVAAGSAVTEPTDPLDPELPAGGGGVRFGSVGEIEEADLTSYGSWPVSP